MLFFLHFWCTLNVKFVYFHVFILLLDATNFGIALVKVFPIDFIGAEI